MSANHLPSIVFMGTPAFAVPALRALFEASYDIKAVYTQPPRPAGRGQKETPSLVHQFALAHNLPVYTPVSLKTPEAQAEFASHKADIAVVVAYGLLLPQAILEAYPLGCVNIHPSALPRWRGAAPLERTIMAGDTHTKIIIMQMDAGLDTGDILLAEDYEIPHGTNAGALHDILAEKSAPLLLKTLQGLREKAITPQKQSEIGVEYAKKITKEEARIDWNNEAKIIYQQILGLAPKRSASFEYKGEIIKIYDATIEELKQDIPAGTIVDDRLGIACKDGVIRPTILRRPNKKRMSLDEFLNGLN